MLLYELSETLEKYLGIKCLIEKRKTSVPDGNLRITTRKTGVCFFHCKEKGDTTGVYIPKKNIKLAKQLAQKQYEEAVAKKLDKIIPIMKRLAKILKQKPIEKCFTKLKAKRQELIEPFEISDEEYAQKWQQQTFLKKTFTDEDPNFKTLKGERVRSKSEVIIANTLKAFDIPYKYEQGYVTKQGTYLYPDFTVLNKRTRKEYVLEHFGMMDNEKYALSTMNKIRFYMDRGFYPGEKLVFTYETSQSPLDIENLTKLIKHYFL